jgi:hypothetical protein
MFKLTDLGDHRHRWLGTALAPLQTMREVLLAGSLLALGASGCASSDELNRRAAMHMDNAHKAAAVGDYPQARDEQRRGEHAYQQADARAYEEQRRAPPPPTAPLPLFDPQYQRR